MNYCYRNKKIQEMGITFPYVHKTDFPTSTGCYYLHMNILSDELLGVLFSI